MSQSYKVINFCQTDNNKIANIFQMKKKQHTELSKQRINQQTGYKIIITLQSYNVIIDCQTAKNILNKLIQKDRNNIHMKTRKDAFNELDKR